MTDTPSLWLGLMTGSSADGCDMVVMARTASACRCLHAHHVAMPEALRTTVLDLLQPDHNELHHAMHAHQHLATWMAEGVLAFLADVGLRMDQIAGVGLHGQTIRHQPNGLWGYTKQIGCPSRLSALLGCPVVADFRSADIAVGGQGAPLAPFFHEAFFSAPNRAVLNLGGIANVTILGSPLIGFDTGPGNALLDAWCMQHQGQPFDQGGQWASTGRVVPSLLTQWLTDPFFLQAAPKSTGRDHFNLSWLAGHLVGTSHRPEDVQATLVQLTAQSVSLALNAYHHRINNMLLCGGGVYNSVLLSALRHALPSVALTVSDAHGVGARWVEAMGFAWLASERMANRAIATQSVTGASRPVVLGGVFHV